MRRDDFAGHWQLVGAAQVDPDSADERMIVADTDAWLSNVGEQHVADVMAASGLLLAIDTGGRFIETSEEGTPEDAMPAKGVLSYSGSVRYLRPDGIASWVRPEEEAAPLFFQDGESKIADSIRRSGCQLIRTINIVTVDLYMTRLVLIYTRIK